MCMCRVHVMPADAGGEASTLTWQLRLSDASSEVSARVYGGRSAQDGEDDARARDRRTLLLKARDLEA